MNKLYIFFTAGCLGALANSLAVWLCGYFDITGIMGVSIAPALFSTLVVSTYCLGRFMGPIVYTAFYEFAFTFKR